MTTHRLIALATLGSIALLGGAYAFQHLGGLHPCKMCLWQRWPHVAAIAIGLIAMATGQHKLAWLGFIAAMATAGIGLYHTGVEQLWWEGPNSCTSGSTVGMDVDDLLDKIMNAPLVRCDEIAWSLWGLSMAAWNAVLSSLCALFWLIAGIRR